jgi:hypothetical protein
MILLAELEEFVRDPQPHGTMRGDATIVIFSTLRRRIEGRGRRHPVAGVGSVRRWIEFTNAGSLMSYWPSLPDLVRRAAAYIDISKHVGRVKSARVTV